MILKLKYFFAFCVIVLGFISCSKEYSQEGTTVASKNGIAIFTFGGAPKSCAVAIPGGIYTAGTAMDSLNTLIISVTVDSIGSYDIVTDTVDGILFSGKGSFAVTGTQTIILNANGTPTTDGTFTFSPGINGCTFTITIAAAPITGIVTNTGGYLTCSINSVDSTFNSSVYADTVTLSGLSSMSISSTNAGSNAMFAISLNNTGPIIPGTYSVVTASNITAMACIINYTDNGGNTWGGGISGQSGKLFKVQVTSISSTFVQGTFSGTLYSSDGTGSIAKVITNGQFNVPLK